MIKKLTIGGVRWVLLGVVTMQLLLLIPFSSKAKESESDFSPLSHLGRKIDPEDVRVAAGLYEYMEAGEIDSKKAMREYRDAALYVWRNEYLEVDTAEKACIIAHMAFSEAFPKEDYSFGRPLQVYEDKKMGTWFVHNLHPDFEEAGYVYLGNFFYVAIRKSDGKIVEIGYEK